MKSMMRHVLVGCLLLTLSARLSAETVYVIDKLLVGVHADKTLDSPIVKVFPSGTQLEVLKREGELAQVKGPEDVTGWVDASYLTTEQPAAVVLDLLEAQNRQLAENLKGAEAKVAELERKLAQRGGAAGTKPGEEKVHEQIEKLRKDYEELQQALTAERSRTRELQDALDRVQAAPPNAPSQDVLEALQRENEMLKRALEEAARRPAEEPSGEESPPAWSWPELPKFLSEGLVVFGAWVLSPTGLLLIGLLLLAVSFASGVYLMDYLQRRRHGGFRI